MALEQIGLAAVLDDKNFQQGLARYSKGIGQMTKLTDGAASVLSGAFFAATGIAVAGIGAMVAASKLGLDATLQWAEGLDKLGDQFGMSGQVASSWQFLMNKVGLSVDEGAQGLNYFTKQLDDFGKATKTGQVTVTPFMTALQKLGVSAYDSKGRLKDFDAIMPQIMDKFSKLPAGVNASALAMDLFGARGGTKFLDFLRQGGAGLKDATAKAKALGLELSTDEVNAAEEFGFAMNELNLGLLGFKNTIGRAVLPIAKQFVEWLNKNAIPPLVDLAKRYAPLLGQALRSVGDILNNKVFPAFRSVFNWIQQNALPIVKRLFDAFQRGGWGSLWNQMLAELRTIWPRIQAFLAQQAQQLGNQIGSIATRAAQWLTAHAPEISKAAGTWAAGFWNWVTQDVLPQVGAQLGRIFTAVKNWISANGPGLAMAFQGIGSQFWDWVTTDAIPKAKANAFLLANALNTALQQNWPTIAAGFEYWKTQFWNWLTGGGGVVEVAFAKMENLSAAIRAWSEAPATKKELNEIGASVARAIMDGLGNLFADQKRGDNLIMTLINNLKNAVVNSRQALFNVVYDLSNSFWTEIFSKFTDQQNARHLAEIVSNGFSTMVDWVVTGFPGLIARLYNAFVAAVNAVSWGTIGSDIITQLWNGLSAQLEAMISNVTARLQGWLGNPFGSGSSGPPPERPSLGYAKGGWVQQTGVALVHRGEYVIPARQAQSISNNNSRTIMPGAIVFQIQGGSNLTERQLENVAYRVVGRVLNGA